MIAERTARTTAAPIALPAAGTPAVAAALADLDFRHGGGDRQSSCTSSELYLAARTMEGSVGYQIVTPLQQADGSVVLVNRGWVPEARKDPAKRRRGPGRRHGHRRRRHPRARRSALAAARQRAGAEHLVLERPAGDGRPCGHCRPTSSCRCSWKPARRPIPAAFPIGGQTKVNLPNDHLQYAITWYALAVGAGGDLCPLSPPAALAAISSGNARLQAEARAAGAGERERAGRRRVRLPSSRACATSNCSPIANTALPSADRRQAGGKGQAGTRASAGRNAGCRRSERRR